MSYCYQQLIEVNILIDEIQIKSHQYIRKKKFFKSAMELFRTFPFLII